MAQRMLSVATAVLSALSAVRGVMPTIEERMAAGECASVEPWGGHTYFPADKQVTPDDETADLFDIKYGDSFKVVVGFVAKEQYVLTQCGLAQPTSAEVDAVSPLATGFTRKYFTVPLMSATAGSTVHLGFLEQLGVQDRIMYIDQYATAACWQKAMGCGATLESSYGNTTRRAEQINEVEAVFMSCNWDGTCDNVHAQANGIHVPAAQDPSPLKTAEYIKFFGAFFNLEVEATRLFNAVNTTYHLAAVDTNAKPKVAWVAYSAPSQWGAAKFAVSMADYKQLMVADAGGQNIDAAALLANLPGLTVSGTEYSITFDDYNHSNGDFMTVRANASSYLLAALAEVNVLIDETYAYDPTLYSFNTFKSNFALTGNEMYNFLAGQKVLRIDGAMSADKGLDWYESRLARPDFALEGLARCLHADSSMRRKYFRNIAKSETVIVINRQNCAKDLPICEASAEPETISTMAVVPEPTTPTDAPVDISAARPTAAFPGAAAAAAAAAAVTAALAVHSAA